MADIAVRSNTGELVPTTRRTDPFNLMREMLNWDPFREMTPYFTEPKIAFYPDFEVKELKDAYLFKADLPGVKDNDIEVTVTGNRLNITGKREEEKEEKAENYYMRERSYGSFTRSFTLPEGADTNAIHADLKNGVLTIAIHKAPEVQAKKISVKPAKS